jgi:hypothetical protein
MLWMFNSIIYSYLKSDTVHYAPEHKNTETACTHTPTHMCVCVYVCVCVCIYIYVQSSSLSLNGFSQNKTLVKRNNTEFTNVSSFTLLLMCITHFTLSCRILLFSLPTNEIFFSSLCILKSLESAWQVLFRPPSLATKGHQNWTHFDSGLLISRTFLPHAGSSCTLLVYVWCPFI